MDTCPTVLKVLLLPRYDFQRNQLWHAAVLYERPHMQIEYKKRLAEGLGTEKAPRILAFKNKVTYLKCMPAWCATCNPHQIQSSRSCRLLLHLRGCKTIWHLCTARMQLSGRPRRISETFLKLQSAFWMRLNFWMTTI